MSAHARHAEWSDRLPSWLPPSVRAYLAHTEGGQSLRAVARANQAHPSTVLRQVRRVETLRDDFLVDAALTRLGRLWRLRAAPPALLPLMETEQDLLPMSANFPDDPKLRRDTLRALKALLEPNAVLVIAAQVEDAVVVRMVSGAAPVRLCVLDRPVAEALALRELIAGDTVGRITRYRITTAGRTEATRLMAEAESKRAANTGRAEDADAEDDLFDVGAGGGASGTPARRGRKRSIGAESPLDVLSRRQRRDGKPWLTSDLVGAALRFRETYELARIGGRLTQDWDALVCGRIEGRRATGSGGGATRRMEADENLAAAIRALGPDLAETVILSVCQEHGMETVEQRLDYPARSGKLALRIALRRLALHYREAGSEGFDLIY